METFLAIIRLLPKLVEGIKAIEGIFPEGGQGKAKLDLFLDLFQQFGDIPVEKIVGTVNAIVKFLKATGVFK